MRISDRYIFISIYPKQFVPLRYVRGPKRWVVLLNADMGGLKFGMFTTVGKFRHTWNRGVPDIEVKMPSL